MTAPALRSAFAIGLSAAAFCVAPTARAGGYDTPMLYAARHMGMGGTAIGYVRDPSALFHNPAGLAHVPHVAAIADFSLLLGGLQASPNIAARNVSSDMTVAPFFLVGGAFRLTPWLSAGLGLYPVASSGATFHYGAPGFEDKTSLLFVEASPALALNLPGKLRLGLGYRVTFVQLERFQGFPDQAATPFLDFKLTGYSFQGFRGGLQWSLTPELELGLVYRHKTTTKVENERGIALAAVYEDVSTEFVLPSKLGAGARYDFNRTGPHLAFALDLEYGFNSQNGGSPLRGTPPDRTKPSSVANVFDWSDSLTLRLGAEYRLAPDPETKRDRVALRAGWVYDSKTANEKYPTAFGTPPGKTQVFTAGVGYDFGLVQSNLALAYRFGEGQVDPSDLSAPNRKPCSFCGAAGDYEIHLTGIYIDVGYSL
jgi:long-subunit fatty acid transport protein